LLLPLRNTKTIRVEIAGMVLLMGGLLAFRDGGDFSLTWLVEGEVVLVAFTAFSAGQVGLLKGGLREVLGLEALAQEILLVRLTGSGPVTALRLQKHAALVLVAASRVLLGREHVLHFCIFDEFGPCFDGFDAELLGLEALFSFL